ncbi:uncharacterized protein LOC133205416 [Saccostrea echinata]|uniref:uncharacterized protein LOC133173372 n=1 Tax=Saccostrea echinata TaxID=191078 RepID=UPI002A8320B4|nr:uncharacterized protein LOC133173372 [Saccostrea echinata]XP_061179126.1 uncharacterized protein LOC133187740 [Saccostrea echinata]XP_061179135.1 uncharacterized protein LOC133187740 [Saccostrea echinata]XP_061185929.1 uncharacterized protein LOC133194024 [Saccostrea echinata]XP_061185930.1 uncharacterized protein LOC133194024 [Saccostrea echinata]XP_061197213.1 uncharacterized protein LOC133205416 [Saccostrea echinata]
MHWILSPEPPVPTLAVPLVEDLISSQEFISAENPIAWMKQKLMINEQQIQQIASLTTGQKENCMWSSVRKNRLTASNFGCVLAAIKRNRYPISLYKRLCSAYDLSKKDAIIWGMCNEKVAIEKYKTFGDAVVEPTGIWLHCNGVLGSSPDGLIRRPAAFEFNYQNPGLADMLEMLNVKPEILEVKCPFSAKNMTIPEAIEKVNDFCLEVQDFHGVKSYRLRENHQYYDQVQGQLYITGKSLCDFMVWTPKDCAIVRINKDVNWGINISVLTDFYFCKFLPYVQQL